jgi:hypothetical protein
MRVFDVLFEPKVEGRTCERVLETKLIHDYTSGLDLHYTWCFALPGLALRKCFAYISQRSGNGVTFPAYCNAQQEQTCANFFQYNCGQTYEGNVLSIQCPPGMIIYPVISNYGSFTGPCGNLQQNNPGCPGDTQYYQNSPLWPSCFNKTSCSFDASNGAWGWDPCYGIQKELSVTYLCYPELYFG